MRMQDTIPAATRLRRIFAALARALAKDEAREEETVFQTRAANARAQRRRALNPEANR